ncbi:MAG: NUDIX domain-containing protein [Nitrospirae bacterium]|nr:NUDIX domain-containing protein [Nitrospirota bacterium]
MEELLEVVNENGEVITTLPRPKIHGNPSLIHRVVHVLVFNKSGNLLLQKRSINKDVAPGKWDTSVGGHINHGESILSALRRETEEELGIKITDEINLYELKFLYSYIHSNPYETELVYAYSFVYEGDIHFAKEEIDEVRPWSIQEINEALGKGIFSDNFEHEFAMYIKIKDSSI